MFINIYLMYVNNYIMSKTTVHISLGISNIGQNYTYISKQILQNVLYVVENTNRLHEQLIRIYVQYFLTISAFY
jgi:hypothetical protein